MTQKYKVKYFNSFYASNSKYDLLCLKSFRRKDSFFFYSPSEVLQKEIGFNELIRVGGLVVEESIVYNDSGLEVFFTITDQINNLNISYKGILPDLFREGQGVVAEGIIGNDKKIFLAKKVLAKHDENYIPPEIDKMLRN